MRLIKNNMQKPMLGAGAPIHSELAGNGNPAMVRAFESLPFHGD
jgi:hypothetical protein